MRAIPSVRRGQPEIYEAGEFQPRTISGATVYVHKSLDEFPRLEIAADGNFFGRRLVLRSLREESVAAADLGCP